jgi:hypothetical protein
MATTRTIFGNDLFIYLLLSLTRLAR